MILLTLKELEAALRKMKDEHDIDFNIHPEVAGSLCNGEVLYRANLGTAEHPFLIYGDKESVINRIKEFNEQILNQLKTT